MNADLKIIAEQSMAIAKSLKKIELQIPTFLSALTSSMLSHEPPMPRLICLCVQNPDGSLKEYNSACPLHTSTTAYLLKHDKTYSQND